MPPRSVPVKAGLVPLFTEGVIVPRNAPQEGVLLFVVHQPYDGPIQPKFEPFLRTLAASIKRDPTAIRPVNVGQKDSPSVEMLLAEGSIEAVFWFGLDEQASLSVPQYVLPPMETVIMNRSAKLQLWKALKAYARA